MKNIVIVGAGFAGITAALGLEKKLKQKNDFSLTLVDKKDYHIYAPNLYEIATAEEELTSVRQLSHSITVPLKEIIDGRAIKFVRGEVKDINLQSGLIETADTKIPYDYLVLALGSVTDFFGVQGAEKFSLTLKSLGDALLIRNQVEFAIQKNSAEFSKSNIRIIVAGGGYTGCEFAAELANQVRYLVWKNSYPSEKIEICVIEAQSQLVSGFSNRMSQDVLHRMKALGIIVHLSSPIFRVTEHFIELVTQEKMEYDVLVWTTGVKAPAIPVTGNLVLDRKGRVVTNGFLQAKEFGNIFAIGDCAFVQNIGGKPSPPTAKDGIEQGKYIAHALSLFMDNRQPVTYEGRPHGFIVALGGKWAIFNYGGFYFTGFFAYMARMVASVGHYRHLVGWGRAFKYLALQWKLYGRND